MSHIYSLTNKISLHLHLIFRKDNKNKFLSKSSEMFKFVAAKGRYSMLYIYLEPISHHAEGKGP